MRRGLSVVEAEPASATQREPSIGYSLVRDLLDTLYPVLLACTSPAFLPSGSCSLPQVASPESFGWRPGVGPDDHPAWTPLSPLVRANPRGL